MRRRFSKHFNAAMDGQIPDMIGVRLRELVHAALPRTQITRCGLDRLAILPGFPAFKTSRGWYVPFWKGGQWLFANMRIVRAALKTRGGNQIKSRQRERHRV
jgi:hypothetical protein